MKNISGMYGGSVSSDDINLLILKKELAEYRTFQLQNISNNV